LFHPNSGIDENNSNDTLTTTVQYYDAVPPINEGFGEIYFLPGWGCESRSISYLKKKLPGLQKQERV
jgi:hypothetical protein